MIRLATQEDIHTIRKMASVVFPATYKKILTQEQLDYMMDMMYSEKSLTRQMTVDKHIFFIADEKGYVSFRHECKMDNGTNLFHLEKLYVMPHMQGTGLGRELFEAVVKVAKSSSAEGTRIELNVNRHNVAVSFYEHLGMHKDRQGDFPIGNGFYMNDYIMAIDL